MTDPRVNVFVEVVDQSKKGLDSAGKATKKFTSDTEKQFEGAGQKVKGFQDNLLAAATAVGTVGTVVTATYALMQDGIAYERSGKALEAYTGNAWLAEKALMAVQEATGGALDKMTASQNAAQLFAMGLAQTAGEAAELTEIAVTLGAAMGRGPQESFENFTLLLANESKLRLDTYGISASEATVKLQELAKAGDGLSSQQRFTNVVLEMGREKLDQLDEAGFQAANSLDVLTARAADAKLELGTFLADGLLPIIDGAVGLSDALEDQEARFAALDELVRDGILTWNELVGTYETAEGATLSEAEALAFLEQRMAAADASTSSFDSTLTGFVDLTVPVVSAAEAMADAISEFQDIGSFSGLEGNLKRVREEVEFQQGVTPEMANAYAEMNAAMLAGDLERAEELATGLQVSAMTMQGDFDGMGALDIRDQLHEQLGIPLGEAAALAGQIMSIQGMDGKTIEFDVVINTIGSGVGGKGTHTPGTGPPGRKIDDEGVGQAASGGWLNSFGPLVEVGEQGTEALEFVPGKGWRVISHGEWMQAKQAGMRPDMGFRAGGELPGDFVAPTHPDFPVTNAPAPAPSGGGGGRRGGGGGRIPRRREQQATASASPVASPQEEAVAAVSEQVEVLAAAVATAITASGNQSAGLQAQMLSELKGMPKKNEYGSIMADGLQSAVAGGG